jgi:hypothetical protein
LNLAFLVHNEGERHLYLVYGPSCEREKKKGNGFSGGGFAAERDVTKGRGRKKKS